MSSKNVTLNVDSRLYDQYRSYCRKNRVLVSQQFEIMMEEKVGSSYKKEKSKSKIISNGGINKYVGSLTGEPIMIHENKIVANLLLKDQSPSSIKELVVQENLFGYKTTKSIPKRVNSILKRIGNLDNLLLNKIVNDLSGDGRVVILYSIYLRDRLFNELLNELIIEKFAIRDFEFEKRMIQKFISDKSEDEKKIQEFTKETKDKLGTVMFNILKEVGLVVSLDKSYKLHNLMISSELRNYYENKGETKFLRSLGASL
ncbi:DUF1819 family protein [Candidatus Woesearchaeota archaeon]|jgi:hypothetical protein|nr:DUF1819 family protein [Candidatus Woesearchaeota archaeon]MBT4111446.1 DUF1819 family protein [Candidatus Woesearchaeota archaeon]MBT4336375.1 DUF1819 family protein [Candidatus Woesearchaeota archaeon]MBT4469970.1 DUF1819 family protein [Candidatus Woesearchaeota archaeon]MBT6744306.1 DUF1819 family protein [Candidatus Woesearchaeota archaeon]